MRHRPAILILRAIGRGLLRVLDWLTRRKPKE